MSSSRLLFLLPLGLAAALLIRSDCRSPEPDLQAELRALVEDGKPDRQALLNRTLRVDTPLLDSLGPAYRKFRQRRKVDQPDPN